MVRVMKLAVVLASAGVLTVSSTVLRAAAPPVAADTLLGTTRPTVFKVTVTKVELYNGTSWVTVFSGSTQLDLASAALSSTSVAFPGISAVSLPLGTYDQARVTFLNSFTVKGSLTATCTLGVLTCTYYTTTTTLSSDSASQASVTPGDLAEVTLCNPSWGALGAPVTKTVSLTPAATIASGTSFAPILKFDINTGLSLSLGGTYYFSLASSIAVTILNPLAG